VGDVLLLPAVAALDGDADDVDVGGLDHHQHRLQVRAAEGVLVDDDLAPGGRRGKGGAAEEERRG